MENKSCLSTIKAEYMRLTKKEQQLADYILDNYEAVVTMTTSELSANAGVVKSVIVRFCQSLGFSGYTEFKLLLSRELAKNEQFHFTPYISAHDTEEHILRKIFSANIKTLHDTAENLDPKQFQCAIQSLAKANTIYIYAVGTSAGIAADFQYRLTEIGYRAFFFTDIANMKVSILNIQKGDVAIGISGSGRTQATVDALKYARERGAATICVTSFPNSRIVKYSDHALVIQTDEIQYPIEAISARIAHISVLDSIAVSLSSRHYEEAVERAAKVHDLVEKIRYQ